MIDVRTNRNDYQLMMGGTRVCQAVGHQFGTRVRNQGSSRNSSKEVSACRRMEATNPRAVPTVPLHPLHYPLNVSQRSAVA